MSAPRPDLPAAPAADADVLARVARDLHDVGEHFFRGLVEHLARTLGADLVIAAEIEGADARTLAFWADGAIVPNVTYPLAGTPCEGVIEGARTCGWSEGIQERFPADHYLVEVGVHAYVGTPLVARDGLPLGLLAALFRSPRTDLTSSRALLEIFAARAGAELERQLAERALRDSERRLELALWGSDLALWDVDLTSGVRHNEGAWEAILGLPTGALPRRQEDWFERIHADDQAHVRTALDEHLTGRSPYYETTYRVRRGDGSWVWMMARGKVVARDADGRALRIVGTTRDLSATKRLEAELLQSQKLEAVGRLAGGVAHDFNNLLTALLSALEFASAEAPPGSALADDLALARETGLRAADLTRQLLAFARKQPVSPRVLDVGALLVETERLLRRTLGGDVRLELRAARGLWPVRADPTQLQQVLVNLALNAREALPAGGTIVIEAGNRVGPAPGPPPTGDAAWTWIAVRDDGVGMDPETLARVFEPFFTTRGRHGTGLGLASSWGIVQQAGGRMIAESAPGAGSTFEVWLPRCEAPAEADERPVAIAGAARGRETVLVVEDDARVRDGAVRGLEQHGYRVHAVDSAAAGLELVRRAGRELALVVTDVVMPGMSGLELGRALREVAPGLPVLYVSGYNEAPQLAQRALEPGAAFLAKPFGPRELAAKVRAVLDGAPA